MSTILNDLYYDGIEVTIEKDQWGEYFVDVQYTRDDGKYEEGEYLAGYAELKTQEDAEFLARAFISGYKLAKEL